MLAMILACTPQPNLICTREFAPVCADSTTQFSNACLARAAGFYGECASRLADGPCRTRDAPELPAGLNCSPDEFYSELGRCVPKPWSDFASCAEEARQGACANGRDPNPWVAEHCAITCSRQ